MKMKAMFSFKAKLIDPCSKMLCAFKHKFNKSSISLRALTFGRSKPRGVRTRVVRFRKPFSLKSMSFPRCRPKKKIRLRKRRAAVPSKVKKALHYRHKRHGNQEEKPVPKVRIAELLTVMFSLRKLPKELDDTDSSVETPMAADVTSVGVSEGGLGKDPFPSPITPAYIRVASTGSKKDSSSEDVQDACRSFESYLVEMIVDEGKLMDLIDVEELLYCWKNLKTPFFTDLVCRFYGELCNDMFPEDDSPHTTSISES